MIETIKAKDLKVGMYVKLGESWLQHPFIKPNFRIKSEKQIRKIIFSGIKEVKVDTLKSDVTKGPDLFRNLLSVEPAQPDSQSGTEIPVPEEGEFNPMDQISEELRAAIENTLIPPQTKAKAVYDHSIRMMDNVLEKPSAENILSGKKMIYDIVDHILEDDDTAKNLSQITSHDYYTYTHSVNVGLLSVLLAKSVFKESVEQNMRELGAGFFLHDLGKCDVPASIINKPGKLTPEEWKIMRTHTSRGNKILAQANQLSKECGLIVTQHHERANGSGYPFGLRGGDIHVYARICTIADVYDALTSMRAYKKKLPTLEALRIMRDEMITHFNRDLFEAFILLFK